MRIEIKEVNKFKNICIVIRQDYKNTRGCEICDFEVHRISFAKHLRSKKISENEVIRQDYKNTRGCEICDFEVHRISFAKHLRSKKLLENDVIIPDWLIQEFIETKTEKCNLKS